MKLILEWGATVNNKKDILQNSQFLLHKSPKEGGAKAPLWHPQFLPLW